MDIEYQNFSDPENQPPPSYTVKVGGLGKVDNYQGDQNLASEDNPEPQNRYQNGDDDDDLSSVDEAFDVLSITSSIEDRLTWRGRMQEVLHSAQFHFVIIFLVVLDVLFVLFELLLDLGAFNNVRCYGNNLMEEMEFCHFDLRSRDYCAPPPRLILQGIAIEPETALEGSERELCECGFRNGKEVCIRESEGHGIDPAIVLHGFSLVILTIFMLEIICKMIAFRLKYFTHKFEVLDGAVVVISWILDIASIIEEEAFEAAQLLIILRLWRILRVINGSVLSSKAQSDAQLHKARIEAKKIIHALHKAQDKIEQLEKEKQDSNRSQEGRK